MELETLRKYIRQEKLANEHSVVNKLIFEDCLTYQQRKAVHERATKLVESCRQDRDGKETLDAFLMEFGLSNSEGVSLMCLAEALLRVPDNVTADRLIAEKINNGDWGSHSGQSDSLFVNASTWGLMMTGQIVHLDPKITDEPGRWVKRLTAKLGEPIIRAAVHRAMKIMGGQYVLGRDIEQGMSRGAKINTASTRFSFDMLGEAARTYEDAQRYFDAYFKAIESIGAANQSADVYDANGISVKLSALHPQYHFSHYKMVMDELLPRIIDLCVLAKEHNIGLSIDAEEAARLDISLDIFEALARHPKLQNWDGLGFVLQAYQKRAPVVAKWLIELARVTNRRLMVRLVKGAYWDAEIKHAQEQGLKDYPVFTRKANTDACYLTCAKSLLGAPEAIFPQFATHNAYTSVAILELAKGKDFEFQRLHGMGNLLYKHLLDMADESTISLRVYAPIGEHEDLLPYLVRRLLENGANSSFVNRFLDREMPVEELVKDVYDQVAEVFPYRHAEIPIPQDIYQATGEKRKNAKGLDLDCNVTTDTLSETIRAIGDRDHIACPIVDGAEFQSEPGSQEEPITSPSNPAQVVGSVYETTDEIIERALESATNAQSQWQALPARERAQMLYRMSDLLESNIQELVGLISHEAGRTLADGVSEVREAVDFCRYYGNQAEQILGVAGTENGLTENGLKACGTFFCISPWNFPLAIFVGQIAAALAVGNTVIAKPAEQTPLVAHKAIQLFHQAGVPQAALNFLTGSGPRIGQKLLPDLRVNGVCFTGSTETARIINQQLASRPGPAIPLIAETGGQNCMIVDSTALPEQVVDDVIASSFLSAGQRCSALRVLYIQKDNADKLMAMLEGAMQSIVIGDPTQLATDVGPVIDKQAQHRLQNHAESLGILNKTKTPNATHPEESTFFSPRVVEIDSIHQLEREVFGPILHVIRYSVDELDAVIEQINATGYGLTLGIHSRIEAFADYVFRKTNVGNTYINRNMVGAVVGVNPFGGNNLSGTGPKAGGPNYLYRFLRSGSKHLIQESDRSTPSQVSNTSLTQEQKDIIKTANQAFNNLSNLTVEQRIEGFNHTAISRLEDSSLNDRNLGDSNLSDSKLGDSDLNQTLGMLQTLAIDNLAQPRKLPGPTGEENLLFMAGKGYVLLLTSDTDSIPQIGKQIGLCLAAGCPIVIAAPESTRSQIQDLVNAFTAAAGQLPDGTLQLMDISNLEAFILQANFCSIMVASGYQDTGSIKLLLSQRNGGIVPLIECPSELNANRDAVAYGLMTYLINEKTRTDNLTARGGNTQLMNLTG